MAKTPADKDDTAAEAERVELPRDHWVELIDPWNYTEGERNAMWADLKKRVGAKPAPAAEGDLPPVPEAAVADDDSDEGVQVRSERGRIIMLTAITAWGGPLLDAKALSAEVLEALPAPLFDAIDQAVMVPLRELFPLLGIRGGPTTP